MGADQRRLRSDGGVRSDLVASGAVGRPMSTDPAEALRAGAVRADPGGTLHARRDRAAHDDPDPAGPDLDSRRPAPDRDGPARPPAGDDRAGTSTAGGAPPPRRAGQAD